MKKSTDPLDYIPIQEKTGLANLRDHLLFPLDYCLSLLDYFFHPKVSISNPADSRPPDYLLRPQDVFPQKKAEEENPLQFSLRSLLIIIPLLGVGLGIFGKLNKDSLISLFTGPKEVLEGHVIKGTVVDNPKNGLPPFYSMTVYLDGGVKKEIRVSAKSNQLQDLKNLALGVDNRTYIKLRNPGQGFVDYKRQNIYETTFDKYLDGTELTFYRGPQKIFPHKR